MPGYLRRIPTWGRYLACLLFAALLFAAWPAQADGQTPSQPLNASGNRNIPLSVDPIDQGEGYSAILYDNRNGLPTSEANAIAQTNDGFLWIGSYASLIRYDGVTFERIESPDGILNTRCLYLDSLGRLWIGTNDFGIFLKSGSSLSRVDQPHQLVSVCIRSMAEDGNGLIYIGTAAGVATVDKDLTLRVVEDERLNAVTIRDLRLGGDGLIYGVTAGGDLFAMRDGRKIQHNRLVRSGHLARASDGDVAMLKGRFGTSHVFDFRFDAETRDAEDRRMEGVCRLAKGIQRPPA